MPNKFSIRQLKIDLKVALGRRGCSLESGMNLYLNNYYDDTPLENYMKSDNKIDSYSIREFITEKFQNISSICRKSHLNKYQEIKESDKGLVQQLINFKILDNDLKLLPNIQSFGNLFECIAGFALEDNNIQNLREVKIRYPFPNKPYDPDGQLYDILGALDISKLLWIECKKPLYLNEKNPLGQVVSSENIGKFIRRASFLKPDIAIYLVDTKEDYKGQLASLFKPEFLTTGNFIDYFEESDNIIARLNGFIYFNRVNYKSNNLFYNGLKNSINQVLYDATKIKGTEMNLNILK